jgi:hypothetical protein
VDDNNFEITKVTVSTEVVRDAPDEPKTSQMLAAANLYASLYTVVYRLSDRSIRFAAASYLHSGNVWHMTFLQALAGLQAAEAERSAQDLAGLVRGSVAESQHPQRGRRTQLDAMLAVCEQVFIPRGQRPSPFVNDFTAVEGIEPNPWVVGTSSSTGITEEFNFMDASKKGLLRHCGDHRRYGSKAPALRIIDRGGVGSAGALNGARTSSGEPTPSHARVSQHPRRADAVHGV